MLGVKQGLVRSAMVVASLATAQVAIAVPQPSLLTVQQQARLKALGIKIAVPGYVPSGFKVVKVETQPCPVNIPRSKTGTCRFGPGYGIVYRHQQQNACFAIEETGGGIGGPAYNYGFPVATKLFGQTSIQFGQHSNKAPRRPTQQQLALPQQNLFMDWGGAGPFYRLIGADFVRSTYYGERWNRPVTQCRKDITPKEAEKIVRSLTWLK